MSFETIQGVVLGKAALEGVRSAYAPGEKGNIDSVLSAELIEPFLNGAVKLLPEPHFFFMELPCTEDEEKELRRSDRDPLHYKVYYLDGCTASVTEAIIKRYGQLLINDGLTRFGFGSNASNEEIYVLDYQQIQVYAEDDRFASVYKKLGVPETDSVKTVWENFSKENVGVSMAVEIEGENCGCIVENLTPEGMYLAETRAFGE
ncbi:MAG: hypothetical protein IKN17_13185 [Ruminococcus sp.]|nr:hypothetical protein [Ruminococcus sp.]